MQTNNLIHVLGNIIAQLLIVTLESGDFLFIYLTMILLVLLQILELFHVFLLLVLKVSDVLNNAEFTCLLFVHYLLQFTYLVILEVQLDLLLANILLQFVYDVMVFTDLIVLIKNLFLHLCFSTAHPLLFELYYLLLKFSIFFCHVIVLVLNNL